MDEANAHPIAWTAPGRALIWSMGYYDRPNIIKRGANRHLSCKCSLYYVFFCWCCYFGLRKIRLVLLQSVSRSVQTYYTALLVVLALWLWLDTFRLCLLLEPFAASQDSWCVFIFVFQNCLLRSWIPDFFRYGPWVVFRAMVGDVFYTFYYLYTDAATGCVCN